MRITLFFLVCLVAEMASKYTGKSPLDGEGAILAKFMVFWGFIGCLIGDALEIIKLLKDVSK